MATKDVSTFLNAVRANSSSAYQTAVPLATATNIADVGAAVLGLPSTVQNEFLVAANKIGLTTISTTSYDNPFLFLKKGELPFGSTIEDLFIEMAKPHEYVAGTRTDDEVPDQYEIFKLMNKAGFYSTQLERQYGMTIHENDMRRAFLSAEGLGNFLSMMYESVRSGENRDDYQMTVALMARQIEKALALETFKGEVKLITLFNAAYRAGVDDVEVTADTALQDIEFLKFVANQFKKWSNRLKFIRKDLNMAGVEAHIPQESQRIMMLADIQADLDTNLFAWAYNEDRLQIGGFDAIDAWYSIGYVSDATTDPVVAAVSFPESVKAKSLVAVDESKVLAVIYDPDMVKIYNKFRTSDVARNARGHYFNTFTTVADIYAASPFKNMVVFTLE